MHQYVGGLQASVIPERAKALEMSPSVATSGIFELSGGKEDVISTAVVSDLCMDQRLDGGIFRSGIQYSSLSETTEQHPCKSEAFMIAEQASNDTDVPFQSASGGVQSNRPFQLAHVHAHEEKRCFQGASTLEDHTGPLCMGGQNQLQQVDANTDKLVGQCHGLDDLAVSNSALSKEQTAHPFASQLQHNIYSTVVQRPRADLPAGIMHPFACRVENSAYVAVPSASTAPVMELWSTTGSSRGSLDSSSSSSAPAICAVGRGMGRVHLNSKTWVAIKERAAKQGSEGAFQQFSRGITKDRLPSYESVCAVPCDRGKEHQVKWSVRWPSLILENVEIQVVASRKISVNFKMFVLSMLNSCCIPCNYVIRQAGK